MHCDDFEYMFMMNIKKKHNNDLWIGTYRICYIFKINNKGNIITSPIITIPIQITITIILMIITTIELQKR